jgi:hypothetical protein
MLKKTVLPLLFIITWNKQVIAQKYMPPPGTIYLNDSVYIDKHPVTNEEYAFFLQAVETFWNTALSDSLTRTNLELFDLERLVRRNKRNRIWQSNQQFLIKRMQIEKDPYKFLDTAKISLKQHLLRPPIKDYPVTGISIEQAVNYCRWRTDIIRLRYAKRTLSEKNRFNFHNWFQYRLSRADEWKTAFTIKGEAGKIKLNSVKPQTKSWMDRIVFMAYPAPFAEWLEPTGIIQKMGINSQAVVIDLTVAPEGAPDLQTGFRCSCDVK